MNFSLEQSSEFCSKISDIGFKYKLVIAPPIPYIAYLANKFPSLDFCAQNVSHFEEEGSYTGEYSSDMLRSCNVKYSIIGHSERRKYFSEKSTFIKKKAQNCLVHGITPIICIGETAESRQDGSYKDFVLEQLACSVPDNFSNIIIAYEPIWSVGTGITPNQEELPEMFDFIKSKFGYYGIANNCGLVYGGSVNLDNFHMIMGIINIDGVLVGKASLDSNTLIKMLNL